MNKTELIVETSNLTGVPQTITQKVLEAAGGIVVFQLQAGEKVTVLGLGTMGVKRRAARMGRNPSTGESLEIPAKNGVKFTPNKTLKDAINEPPQK